MQCFKQQATFYARRKGLEASGRQKDRLRGSRTLRLKEASTYEMKKSISKHLSQAHRVFTFCLAMRFWRAFFADRDGIWPKINEPSTNEN